MFLRANVIIQWLTILVLILDIHDEFALLFSSVYDTGQYTYILILS